MCRQVANLAASVSVESLPDAVAAEKAATEEENEANTDIPNVETPIGPRPSTGMPISEASSSQNKKISSSTSTAETNGQPHSQAISNNENNNNNYNYNKNTHNNEKNQFGTIHAKNPTAGANDAVQIIARPAILINRLEVPPVENGIIENREGSNLTENNDTADAIITPSSLDTPIDTSNTYSFRDDSSPEQTKRDQKYSLRNKENGDAILMLSTGLTPPPVRLSGQRSRAASEVPIPSRLSDSAVSRNQIDDRSPGKDGSTSSITNGGNSYKSTAIPSLVENNYNNNTNTTNIATPPTSANKIVNSTSSISPTTLSSPNRANISSQKFTTTTPASSSYIIASAQGALLNTLGGTPRTYANMSNDIYPAAYGNNEFNSTTLQHGDIPESLPAYQPPGAK